MSLPKLLNFIHGELLENKSGQSFDVINPATNEVIYQTEIADDFIKDQAIESAKQGFATWSAMSAVERSRILLKAVALLRERNDDLAKVEVMDTPFWCSATPEERQEAINNLTEEQRIVALENGTERPFFNEYWNSKSDHVRGL